MVFTIGAVSEQGRKVMLDYRRSESKPVNQYFFYLSPEQAPTLAWTQVPMFGKLTARLLNPGEIRKSGLVACPPPLLRALKPNLEEPCHVITRSRLAGVLPFWSCRC